jgi:hypothetical protein
MTSHKTRAEMQAAATERQTKQAKIALEIAMNERDDYVERVRAFRLAKEAARRKRAADAVATEAAAGSNKTIR